MVNIESSFFSHEREALNFPARFLRSLERKHKLPITDPIAVSLLKIRALDAMGDSVSALSIMKKLRPQLEGSANHFFLGKLYLYHYNIINFITADTKLAADLLTKAMSASRFANNKILECQLLVVSCLSALNEYELTHHEDVLQKAMKLAIEADSVDCIVMVYLGYVNLYCFFQIPDMANRELQMLQEICTVKEFPYHYVQMKNMFALTCLSLGNKQEAGKSLNEAMAVAIEHGHRMLQVPLLINLGILNKQNNDPQKAIECYNTALEILETCGASNSSNAHKVQDNLGFALSVMGKLQEASDLMQKSLQQAQKNKNLVRANIIQVNLANAYIDMERFQESEKLLEDSIEYFTNTKKYAFLQSAWLTKARLFEAKGEFEPAFNCMEELYQVSQLNYRENIRHQAEKLTHRIQDLRKEYMIIRSQCSNNIQKLDFLQDARLVGEHPKLQKAINMAMQAARYPYVNVLISGESGTGKEIIARMIHENSAFEKRMIAVNASAIPPNLMESELFGHVKGAFTGAINDHKGRFQMADKSTLFLDEISEMPIELQAKLLRAIENHSISPVGSDREIPVQCRIICATNRKMSDLIHKNLFRLDLYHRLNKVEINLPPLRERISDLVMLTEHFVEKFARDFGQPVPTIEESFYQRLRNYGFPGNIRELMNILERIFILKPKVSWDESQLDGLVEDATSNQPEQGTIQQNMEQTEYQIILNALKKTNWVQKDAANLLGMTESTLSRHKKRLGIKR